MIQLNLPPFDHKVKKAEGKLWIFDVIRKKYVALIPEEWVRQHFIHFLISNARYPKSLIKVEGGLQFNQLQKRTDLVVFDRQGAPWMIVECKAPNVQISALTLSQAAMYNSTLRAKYITVSNGLAHLYAEINWTEGSTRWLDSLPPYL
jgi:hypothetical protein